MSASREGQIWYRATVLRQKYQTIIEEMAAQGHVVTIGEIRAIVAKDKEERASR